MLSGCTIRFSGNNGVIVLRKSRYYYKIDLTVYNNGLFYAGLDGYYNGVLHAICSEGRFIILGDDCLFSFGIWIRTADPHLIYDAKTRKRMNYSKDVLVGDHVWVGQDSMLLKGTYVGSGSIIGAKAVTSGQLFSYSSWGGVPARCIGKDLFWDRPSVHNYTDEDTNRSRYYSGKPPLFRSDETTLDATSFLDVLHCIPTAEERTETVRKKLFKECPNRFYIPQKSPSKRQGFPTLLNKSIGRFSS